MKKSLLSCALLGAAFLAAPGPCGAQNAEFLALQAHFDRVAGARSQSLFSGVGSVPEWEGRKLRTRATLAKMLWHDYRPPAAPPRATVTSRVERREYTIENLVIESAPHLYLTANLYLPRTGRAPFPVVLYQCGHANKSHYARHGAWLAAHGIATLVMDNIEMGEIEFTHHGVFSHAWFHWYSRGFSPLAVELLNAVRALDYLCARPDIDKNRVGATGRSGGGMTTFFLAALDERIKASAPVSGTLSTAGWISHRLTSAHCDCQYPVNSHGLLYSEIGALTAPRAQLLCNADADRGFPMDSLNEMAAKMREIYRLYKADAALDTAVAPGGHADTEAIRLPVWRFFLKELLGIDAPLAAEGPTDVPAAEDLVCFRDGLPLDERLSRIDEELIPAASFSRESLQGASAQVRARRIEELTGALRNEVFRYFPKQGVPVVPTWEEPATLQGRTVRKVSFGSFEGLRVQAIYSLPAGPAERQGKLPAVLVVDHRKGIPVWGNEQPLERNQWGARAVLIATTLDRGARTLEQNLRSFSDDDPLHHMRRQAMIMGTTLESMQVYEVLRSIELLRSLPEVDGNRITIAGRGEAGVNGLYASLLDGNVERVILGSPPASHRQGPCYLGILRSTDIPEVVALLGGKVRLYGEVPAALAWHAAQPSLAECLR